MRIAGIDIGSNAVRMLVAEALPGRPVKRLRYERAATRLADFTKAGRLSAKGMNKTIKTLRRYAEVLSGFDVEEYRAVGTSALREAKNSAEFLDEVERLTSIEVEVITPREEAQLTAKGVMGGLPPIMAGLILDIGGGSTEFMLVKNGKLAKTGSFPAGVVKLLKKNRTDFEREIKEFLDWLSGEASPLPEGTRLVLTGGTGSTIGMMDMELPEHDHERIQGHEVNLKRLSSMERRLRGLSPAERRHVKGLPADRADLITPGLGLTINIMKYLGLDALTISDAGLPEGIIYQLIPWSNR